MLDEPVDDAGDIRTQPHTVGDCPGVDATVDFAAPVGQVFVLPATVLGEKLDGMALTKDAGIKAPFPQ